MSNQPIGSLAVHGPSLTAQVIHVSSSTCEDLSSFKDLLKAYRTLDDSITMRLNRANAAARDQEREKGRSNPNSTVQDSACLSVWKDLIANWSRRDELINYCGEVMDKSMEEKRALHSKEESPSSSEARKLQAQLFAKEVKRNQIRNEFTVESIVRQRSIQAFRSRCRYFTPPLNDESIRRLWEAS